MVTFIVLNPDNRSGIVTGPWSDPDWVPPGGLLITTNQLIQHPNNSGSFQRTEKVTVGTKRPPHEEWLQECRVGLGRGPLT